VEPLSVDTFFLIDSAVIRNSQEPGLVRLIEYLKEHPETKVVLSGYADKETGTPPYNLRLSERRVQSVKTFLTVRGIDPARIETVAHGDRVQPYHGVKNRVVISEAAVR
jgi:outer membrane protein OmpA-like peptidoglycan-associated protein